MQKKILITACTGTDVKLEILFGSRERGLFGQKGWENITNTIHFFLPFKYMFEYSLVFGAVYCLEKISFDKASVVILYTLAF